MKPIRVAHISDIHLLQNPEALLAHISPYQRLKRVLEYVQKRAYDWVILTGDLTEDAHPESYALLKKLLDPLQVNIVLIAGNHDSEEVLIQNIPNQSNRWVAPKIPISLGVWQLLTLDTPIPNKPEGYVTEAALARLKAQLSASPGPFCILMHHPLFNTGIFKLDQYGTTNRDQVIPVLKTKRIQILCGHVHGDYTWNLEGITCDVTPATCFQFNDPKHNDGSANFIPKSGYVIDNRVYGFKEYCFTQNLVQSNTVWFDEKDG